MTKKKKNAFEKKEIYFSVFNGFKNIY